MTSSSLQWLKLMANNLNRQNKEYLDICNELMVHLENGTKPDDSRMNEIKRFISVLQYCDESNKIDNLILEELEKREEAKEKRKSKPKVKNKQYVIKLLVEDEKGEIIEKEVRIYGRIV